MASALGFALFPTAIGHCGIAWGEAALVGVQLPEGDEAAGRARMQRRFPAAAELPPPPRVQAIIERVTATLTGTHDDLLDVPLDMSEVPPFNQRVLEAARRIPPGRFLTYGEMAAQLGEPGAARAVGQALGHNPFAPIVPCHRILAAGGKTGGFSANGGAQTKMRMLEIEGAFSPDTLALFQK
ncbi:MAG: methylated-DNA--[protein]-cysteine S-methyltransferase [Pseudomonadota bacterium]